MSAIDHRLIPLAAIDRGDPRERGIDDTAVAALAESLGRDGLLQPPKLRPLENGRWAVIFGHRRLLAAACTGWKEVPVLIEESDTDVAAGQFLAENLGHRRLNPFEEALTWQSVSATGRAELGRWLPHLCPGPRNRMLPRLQRCLTVPVEVRPFLAAKEISPELLAPWAALPAEAQVALVQLLERAQATAQEARQIVERAGRLQEQGGEGLPHFCRALAAAGGAASWSKILADGGEPATWRTALVEVAAGLERATLQLQSGSEFCFTVTGRVGSAEDLQRLQRDLARLAQESRLQAIFRGGR